MQTNCTLTAQYATYATQSNGKPAYRPSQKVTFPMSLFCLIAGIRPMSIIGIWTIWSRKRYIL